MVILPCCGHEVEDQTYLYTCKHDKMVATVTENIAKMKKALTA